jgi:hypothetical protein
MRKRQRKSLHAVSVVFSLHVEAHITENNSQYLVLKPRVTELSNLHSDINNHANHVIQTC